MCYIDYLVQRCELSERNAWKGILAILALSIAFFASNFIFNELIGLLVLVAEAPLLAMSVRLLMKSEAYIMDNAELWEMIYAYAEVQANELPHQAELFA